jgi:hypothetical protein
MLDPFRVALPVKAHGHHVKADGGLTPPLKVNLRDPAQALLFAMADALLGKAELDRGPGPYLHENQGGPVTGHQVDFPQAAAEVALLNAQPLLPQVFNRQSFRLLPQQPPVQRLSSPATADTRPNLSLKVNPKKNLGAKVVKARNKQELPRHCGKIM